MQHYVVVRFVSFCLKTVISIKSGVAEMYNAGTPFIVCNQFRCSKKTSLGLFLHTEHLKQSETSLKCRDRGDL